MRLDIVPEGQGYAAWDLDAPDIKIIVDKVREDRWRGLVAEVTVPWMGQADYGPVDLVLRDPNSRLNLCRALGTRNGKYKWSDAVDYLCSWIVRQLRHVDTLAPMEMLEVAPTPYLASPLIPYGEDVVLYADGESGKSLIALALAWSLSLGRSLLPGVLVPDTRTPVAYLDWETDTQDRRNWSIGLGAGVEPGSKGPYYIHVANPITDSIESIRQDCERLRIALVIVDSFAFAAGAEPETADAAMRVFRCLHLLRPAATLLIAHIPHVLREANGPSRPYGSVFVRNSARVCWEMTSSQSKDLSTVLTCTKNNLGPRAEPLAFKFGWDGPACRISSLDPSENPDLLAKLPGILRVEAAIRDHCSTYGDIAEVTGLTTRQIQTLANMLEQKGVISRHKEAGKYGKVTCLWIPPDAR